MSITPYTISASARRIARESGFDIDNPDRRYPVQNLAFQKIQSERGKPQDSRARLLLKGRDAMNRVLGRGRSK